MQPSPSLVNLTPHAVTIVAKDGADVLTIVPSGTVARVSVIETADGSVTVPAQPVAGEAWTYGVPLITSAYGDVVGLPAPAENTIFIVSTLVRLAVPNRRDVVSPAVLARDSAGVVIGCRKLERNQ